MNYLVYFSIYIGLFLSIFYILSILAEKKIKIPLFDEKKAPMVSIIIPAYNEEKGIAQTIKSACNINYPKDRLEIIVVDDGSRDKTYKIALENKSKQVRVFRLEKNSGKGCAMNFAIKKANGEFIITMDADNTIVETDALIKMIPHFFDKEVICVSPSMVVYNPRGILQRVQQIEYLFGIFLRKSFATLNAIHITPGAFSAYRKSFFDKYGLFPESNLTEDMEMALRIQYNNFRIVNEPSAVIYTVVPNKFKALMIQRRRWYAGLLKNLKDYKELFSHKYGAMGLIILPTAIITIITTILLVSRGLIKAIFDIYREIELLNAINFEVGSLVELNKYALYHFVFLFLSDPLTIFFVGLSFFLVGFLIFAKTKIKKHSNFGFSLILFLSFFTILFAFWWVISLFYALFNKKVSWR